MSNTIGYLMLFGLAFLGMLARVEDANLHKCPHCPSAYMARLYIPHRCPDCRAWAIFTE